MAVMSFSEPDIGHGGTGPRLSDLHALLRANRRITHLCAHISAWEAPRFVDLSATALVPMPGTRAHNHWQRALRAQGPRSRGAQVLEEWIAFFQEAALPVKGALRRLAVIAGH